MRYSFSGTINPTQALLDVLRADIEDMSDGTEFTTGLAIGIDSEAMMGCHRRWPEAIHRVVVPSGLFNSESLAYAKRHGFVIEHAPKTNHPFRPRNELLVAHCDLLRAYPEGHEEAHLRSGTWMTVRIARKQKVQYVVRYEQEKGA